MFAQDYAPIKPEKEWTPEFIQEMKDLELYLGDDGEWENDAVVESTSSGYHSVNATPIIQVFCVSIETNVDNNIPFEIYGSIRGTVGQGNSFLIYDRACEDAETIWKRGNLSLIGPETGFKSLIFPENGILFPFMGINLDIYLKDRTQDVEVIKGSVNLDYILEEEEDSFDKLLKVAVQGEYGIAYVYYAIFQFAVLGIVDVALTELKYADSDGFADIYGSLVAGYGNSKRYCSNDDELKYLKSTLLRMPSTHPRRIVIGDPIALSRCVVVMPTYSSMKVEANLCDSLGGIIIADAVEIGHGGDSIVHIESQYARLRVQVKWRHAYLQLYKNRNAIAQNKSNEDKNSTEMLKKPKVISNKQLEFNHSLSGFETLCVSGVTYWAQSHVEVFSIHVGGISKDISTLCGTIFIDDGTLTNIYIYNKDESSFELLADDNFVSIDGPYKPIRNMEFGIGMNLKDPVQDLEVSKGYMRWQVGSLEANMSWLDKCLCTVIRGKDGFAAVHYTIFENAFAANVEARIIFNSPDDVPANVYGRICTYYSCFDYSKKYQKNYYRSRLLNLPHSKSVELKTGSVIPLCKYVVAVPVGSHLFIEADLRITLPSADENSEEVVLGIEEFDNNMSSTCKVINGVDCKIELSVKFFGDGSVKSIRV